MQREVICLSMKMVNFINCNEEHAIFYIARFIIQYTVLAHELNN
jgi:hypothetical protein